MSGIFKKGLDWAIVDVDVLSNKKIKKILRKNGQISGFIIFGLWLFIYKNDYYIIWDEDTQLDFAEFVNLDLSVVIKVVDDCINVGLFDKGLFEKYHILTSEEIQKRFFNATKRRDKVNVNTDYLLCEHHAYKNFIFVDQNGMNVNKERQSRVENIREENKISVSFDLFKIFYNKYPGKKLSVKTEFENFKSKHADYEEVIPMLDDIIQKQILNHNKKMENREFIPSWKNMSNWLSNRCWEESCESVTNNHYDNQTEQYVSKSQLRIRLEELPLDTQIIVEGMKMVKDCSTHLRTDSGALPIGDFEKYFKDFEILNNENK